MGDFPEVRYAEAGGCTSPTRCAGRATSISCGVPGHDGRHRRELARSRRGRALRPPRELHAVDPARPARHRAVGPARRGRRAAARATGRGHRRGDGRESAPNARRSTARPTAAGRGAVRGDVSRTCRRARAERLPGPASTRPTDYPWGRPARRTRVRGEEAARSMGRPRRRRGCSIACARAGATSRDSASCSRSCSR